MSRALDIAALALGVLAILVTRSPVVEILLLGWAAWHARRRTA